MLGFFLNQARASHRPVCTWFLEINLVREVCMCVCVCVSAPRLLITSGVMWTPYDWLKKVYSFYMAIAVIISSRRGFRIKARSGN